MSTIRSLAAEHGMQPYELAALLDLGAHYSETADLDEVTETEYREIVTAAKRVTEPASTPISTGGWKYNHQDEQDRADFAGYNAAELRKLEQDDDRGYDFSDHPAYWSGQAAES